LVRPLLHHFRFHTLRGPEIDLQHMIDSRILTAWIISMRMESDLRALVCTTFPYRRSCSGFCPITKGQHQTPYASSSKEYDDRSHALINGCSCLHNRRWGAYCTPTGSAGCRVGQGGDRRWERKEEGEREREGEGEEEGGGGEAERQPSNVEEATEAHCG